MASKVVRYAFCCLGLAAGTSDWIIDYHYHGRPPKTIRQMAERLQRVAHDAFSAWGDPADYVDGRNARDIQRALTGLHKTYFQGPERCEQNPVFCISFSMAVISDLYDEVGKSKKAATKRAALAQVQDELKKWHRYFDRRIDVGRIDPAGLDRSILTTQQIAAGNGLDAAAVFLREWGMG